MKSKTNLIPAYVSVINTLCYGSLFDYPLTFNQIYKFLIISEHFSKKEIKQAISDLKGILIEQKFGTFFLKGEEFLAEERKKRHSESKIKLVLAKKIINVLSLLPTIRLIGISGSLSMQNSRSTDDIDLFIIARKGTLWITRFLVNALLLLKGVKRVKKSFVAKNRVCPNMFISSDNLSMQELNRNLFIAHEIVQLRIMLNRNRTYEKFLVENLWVLNFLPNAFSIKSALNFEKRVKDKPLAGFKHILSRTAYLILEPVEQLFFKLQFLYMKSAKTSEVTTYKMAKFHPVDQNQKILILYEQKRKSVLEKLYKFFKQRLSLFPLNTLGY